MVDLKWSYNRQCPRNFQLRHNEKATAWGTQFPDGTVVVRTLGGVQWSYATIEAMVRVHPEATVHWYN